MKMLDKENEKLNNYNVTNHDLGTETSDHIPILAEFKMNWRRKRRKRVEFLVTNNQESFKDPNNCEEINEELPKQKRKPEDRVESA